MAAPLSCKRQRCLTPGRPLPPWCSGPDGKSLEPEVYPRPAAAGATRGTVYICGVSEENVPVPATAADVAPRPDAIDTLRAVAASVSQARSGGGRAGGAAGGAAAGAALPGSLTATPAAFPSAPTHCAQKLGAAEVHKQQACYLPCSDDGLPLIGRVPGLPNCYLATGHSCWGILNAPATGEALAELIIDGEPRSSSLRAFDPARLARVRR